MILRGVRVRRLDVNPGGSARREEVRTGVVLERVGWFVVSPVSHLVRTSGRSALVRKLQCPTENQEGTKQTQFERRRRQAWALRPSAAETLPSLGGRSARLTRREGGT